MKKLKILSILFCLAILFAGCKKEQPNPRKIYLTKHSYGSGHIDYTYDDNGRLIGETTINARGETDMHLTYSEFNTANMPVRINSNFLNSPLHKPYLIIEYDGNARPVKVINYATDGTSGPYNTYTYLTGRIEYRTFSASGTQQYLTIYTLDNRGNVTTFESFDADNVSTWKINYAGYDDKKAPAHPYKYLATVLSEAPNFFSVNNYTSYETYHHSTLDAQYTCTYTHNQQGYTTAKLITDQISHASWEQFYEYVER